MKVEERTDPGSQPESEIRTMRIETFYSLVGRRIRGEMPRPVYPSTFNFQPSTGP
jgi:hypothetical protein